MVCGSSSPASCVEVSADDALVCLQMFAAQRDDSAAHQATASAPPGPVDGASLPAWPPFGPLPGRADVTALLYKTGVWARGLVRRLLAQLAPGADPRTELAAALGACAGANLTSDELQRAAGLVQVLQDYSTSPTVDCEDSVYVHCRLIGGVLIPEYVGETDDAVPRTGQHWTPPADIRQSEQRLQTVRGQSPQNQHQAVRGQSPQNQHQAVHYFMADLPEGTTYVIFLLACVPRRGPYKNKRVARRAVEQMLIEDLHTHCSEGGQNGNWPMQHQKDSHFRDFSTSRSRPSSAAGSAARRATLSKARVRS